MLRFPIAEEFAEHDRVSSGTDVDPVTRPRCV